MISYEHLMSMFVKPPEVEKKPQAKHLRKVRKTGLYYSDALVRNKSGEAASLSEVIGAYSVTVIFFGSHQYAKSNEMLEKLKLLYERSKETDKLLGVVYAPMFTYKESGPQVEIDFKLNHGDWWMLDYRSLEVVESALLHGLTTLPTLLVVDHRGAVVTDCGQIQLASLGNDVLVTWF